MPQPDFFEIARIGREKKRDQLRFPAPKKIGTPRFGRPTGDWYLIHGELVTFTDPQQDLPPIDRLEGFRPGGHSMYQRVMVAVLCGRISIPAWIYWMPNVENGTRLDSAICQRA